MINSLISLFVFLPFCTFSQETLSKAEMQLLQNANKKNVIRILKTTNHEDSLLLRSSTKSIKPNTIETNRLIDILLATVKDEENDGVGIAAPQIGISRSIFIIQRFDKLDKPFEAMLNPIITWRSNLIQNGKEGCLSIPDTMGIVDRHYSIQIRYQDKGGNWIEEVLEGFTAIIFQHEYDHLNGILFLDRIIEQEQKNYYKNQQVFKYLLEQNTR